MNSTSPANEWSPVLNLEASVAMDLEVPGFTVAGLMRLMPGSILTTKWATNSDLPLRVNGLLLAWAEFETTGENVGVRLTEFAWEHPQISK